MTLVVIVPASNEEAYIGPCLEALLAQTGPPALHVIVSANACRDETVARVRALVPAFAARGHFLECIDSPEPGKPGALNRAEAAIPAALAAAPRAYLDADVICDPTLLAEIAAALAVKQPRYATGTLAVMRARSAVTRAYGRIWVELPFVRSGAVGAGLFAVNAAGRARWDAFPAIISDDTYVRLAFRPGERLETPARYHWPMVEGFGALVRVRRRQNAGVDEIRRLHPERMANEGKLRLGRMEALRLGLRRPFAALVYIAVHIAVRFAPARSDWTRGR